MNCDEACTRRVFLRNTGLVAATAGITLAATGLPKFATPAAAKSYNKWGYNKLDTNEVANIAYENYMGLFCASTVLKGIFTPLAKSVGAPFTTFPVESMKWAHGGVAGWGTVCGTLIGASTAVGFITGDTDTTEAMANDLMFYYGGTVLPVFKPATGKWAEIKNTTRAGFREGIRAAAPSYRRIRKPFFRTPAACRSVLFLKTLKDESSPGIGGECVLAGTRSV